MFSEDDLLPISALQHFIFCKRQWALIHLERQWEENLRTVEGNQMHLRVHDGDASETRRGLRIARALKLHSFSLGLVGEADVVEFETAKDGGQKVRVVEYKRGKPKKDGSDEVQLCAQALCLEEMLGISMEEASFFYGTPRRRYPVELTEELRQRTRECARELHIFFREARTPPAEYRACCKKCSLYNLCLPQASGKNKSVQKYMERLFRDHKNAEEEAP